MQVLSRPSLRNQAANAIRAGILGGEFLPNEIYSAAVLAQRLGVSATPVREAMQDLAGAGLVEAVPNRGYRVLDLADEDLDEISELRMMLEVPALDGVVSRATDQQIAALEPMVERIDELARTAHLSEFLLADREFHLALLGLSGNRRLVRLVAQLRDQTRLVGMKELADKGRLFESAAAHRPIVAAIHARDAPTAKELLADHLVQTRGVWAGRNPER